MAYYLQFDGSNDRVDVTRTTLSGDFKVTVVAFFAATRIANRPFMTDRNSNTTTLRTQSNDGGRIELRIGSSNGVVSVAVPDVPGQDLVIIVSRVGTSLTLNVNGTTDTVTDSSDFIYDSFGRDNFGNASPMSLKSIEVENSSSVVIHDYDPSATNGTGLVLEDTAGTNDGSLSNFSGVTNSWWVFYSVGSVSIPVIMNQLRNQGIS
jgi:hypothetical protein